MGLFRDLRAALSEGLTDLLQSRAPADEVEEVTSLLEADVNETRTELNLVRADEKRLKGRIEQEKVDAQRLHQQAQEAVDRGDDEAARDYLRRQRRSLRGADILASQLAEQQQLIELLAEHAEELDDKLQEVRLRRDFLRARHKARALKDRYERYRRDFGLDPPSLAEEFDLSARTAEAEVSPDELFAERVERRPRRHATGDEPNHGERAPEPVSGLGEMPRPRRREDQPALRPAGPVEEESEQEAPWERPARDMRVLREELLGKIEAQQRRDAAFEAELDAELAALKSGTAGHRPTPVDGEPARTPELPPTPAVELEAPDQPGTDTANGNGDAPPTLQPEAPPPAPDQPTEATDDRTAEPGPGA